MASITTALPRDVGLRRSEISWSAIFAGCFMFLAIEVTFGLLGLAIFATAANPNAAHPVGGMSTGIGIWTIVLSIIALYFAGKTAGRLSGTVDRTIGMYHGLVTFGMSIFATVLIASLAMGSTSAGANASQLGSATIASAVSTGGWWLFFAFLLAFIASAAGGSHGAQVDKRSVQEPTSIDRNIRAA